MKQSPYNQNKSEEVMYESEQIPYDKTLSSFYAQLQDANRDLRNVITNSHRIHIKLYGDPKGPAETESLTKAGFVGEVGILENIQTEINVYFSLTQELSDLVNVIGYSI